MALDNDANDSQYPADYPTDAGAEARANADAERAAPEQPAAPAPEQAQPYGQAAGDPRRRMPNDFPQASYPRQGQQAPRQPYPPYSQQPGYGQPYPQYPQQPYAPMYGPARPERRRGGNGWKWAGGCLAGCLGALILLTLLIGLAVGGTALAFFGSVPVSSNSTQTFQVAGTPTVHVHGRAGDVNVVPGDTGTVVVATQKHARGWTRGDAEKALRDMTITFTQTGDTVDVQVNEPDGAGWHWLGERSVRLDITVPAQANVDTTLNAGNVEVRGVTGNLTVENDAGNVTLDGVTLAGASSLRDHAGNIEVRGALQSGGSLEARTNAGNVEVALPKATDAHLTASTHAGNIDVDSTWNVSVSRNYGQSTANGDLQPNPHGSLTLETDAGNITLDAAA